jgi:PKD repeat protein
MSTMRWTCACTLTVLLWSAPQLQASTIFVAAGGDLQQALDAAQPGDTILLEENAEFVGNFVLPLKTGTAWITLRSAAPDTVLPPAGIRIQPSHSPLLARLRSPNSSAALLTAPGAHHWALRYLDFPANDNGLGDIVQIGDGSSAQNSLDKVPHHITLNHVYVHGSPLVGQKRGVALNAANVTISDSYIAECKGIGQDTQAIGGWNGPGPYVIENNYLEAAGENVMFGGADPGIANLVVDGVTVRRNYLSRPMSWRNPIVATPAGLSASWLAGGSLPAGVYGYRVVARRNVQSTVARSTASAEVSVTTGAEGAVRVRWQAVAGATEYWVYGRTPGAQAEFWVATTTELVDTGAVGTSGSAPTTAGTVWSVKNVFELKNARNVVVEENILENHWKESQPGYAIVFTPRNSQGACTWCVVEHVRFERNIVRNVAAAFNVLGYDTGSNPSKQTHDIVIRQNVVVMSTSLGGNGWFMQVGGGPRDIAVEHNTIDSNGNTVLYVYGGTSAAPGVIYGFKLISNAARHGTYGINGQFFAYGNAIMTAFFPDMVCETNYLAGGSLARLCPGTIVSPTFPEQFVDSAGGDYTLRAGSNLRNAASDHTDIGAAYPSLRDEVDGVAAGRPSVFKAGIPVAPAADFTSSCSFLSCSFTDASLAGSSPIAARTWSFGDGSSSASGSSATHVFPAAGSFTVTLLVADSAGLSSASSRTVSVAAPVPPAAALTVSCAGMACTYADTSTPGSGALVSRSWSFGDGSAMDNAPASGTHAFAQVGTYTISVAVTDANGLSASAARTVTIPPPNVAPTAGFTASCVDLTCSFTDRSTDSDGTIAAWNWNFGAGTSTAAAPSFKFAAPGTYQVMLTVTDDDGARGAVTKAVQVGASIHAAYSGTTLKWSSASGNTQYWSATITTAVHGLDERAIAGATVTAAWTGAVVKTVTCVTDAAGKCVLKSGTLSYGRSTVTLNVTAVVSAGNTYNPAGNHDQTGTRKTALTLIRP